MKIWPFTKKDAGQLAPVNNRGWAYRILESFTGAWQQNVVVDRESVLAYWAVYACISLISGDISKMRVKLMERGENGIWFEQNGNSPFWPVLRKPNRYQTRQQFFDYWYSCLLIHGNTYALKERDSRGIVTNLYILDPCGVTVLVSEDGGVYYRLRRDNLNGRADTGEVLDITVPASEIIHDRMVCLHHPLIGVSPIFACGVAAMQGLAIQNNSANFFTNGALPGGIIKVPGSLDAAKALQLKETWDTGYTGTNRGKTAILADKMEYQPLTINATDSQLIEQLKMTAEMVCSTFKVPAYKVGVGAMPAYNNIAALDQQYYSQCLQVLIEGTELVFDEGLGLTNVSGRTIGIEFDLEGLIRMDPMAQMDFAEKGVKAGVLKPNEGRRGFDLEPVAGGDTPYLQQQNYSLAALAKRDAQEDPFATTPTPTPPEPELPPPDEPVKSVDYTKALESFDMELAA